MRVMRIVNVIPNDHSNETNDDSEPSVAVNPNDPQKIGITAFTPPDAGNPNGPVFYSSDGGESWSLRFVLAGGTTHDESPRFAKTSNELYLGTLRGDTADLNILRTGDPSAGVTLERCPVPGSPPADSSSNYRPSA